MAIVVFIATAMAVALFFDLVLFPNQTFRTQKDLDNFWALAGGVNIGLSILTTWLFTSSRKNRPQPGNPQVGQVVFVPKGGLTIRADPDPNLSSTASFQGGDTVRVLEVAALWARVVSTEDENKDGWVDGRVLLIPRSQIT